MCLQYTLQQYTQRKRRAYCSKLNTSQLLIPKGIFQRQPYYRLRDFPVTKSTWYKTELTICIVFMYKANAVSVRASLRLGLNQSEIVLMLSPRIARTENLILELLSIGDMLRGRTNQIKYEFGCHYLSWTFSTLCIKGCFLKKPKRCCKLWKEHTSQAVLRYHSEQFIFRDFLLPPFFENQWYIVSLKKWPYMNCSQTLQCNTPPGLLCPLFFPEKAAVLFLGFCS